MSQIRLDKWLADAGVGTRSQVKEYLKKGRVRVNGEPVKKPETRISEETDEVSFDGEILSRPGLAWYMFHKPAGCITAARNGRTETVMDYFAEAPEKELAPVGRLDKDTEGLLLLTNDGGFAHRILSPKKHVDKIYYAKIEGPVTEADVDVFAEGMDIGEKRRTLPGKLKILFSGEISEIELTIQEGKFHQVKRMMAAVGTPVIYLKRIAMGSLTLPDDLKKGDCRPLTEEEVRVLRR